VTPQERASEAAEAVRWLNHETLRFAVGYPPDGEPLPEGYTWPSDVYATIGQLETMLQRAPQALRQMFTWLDRHHQEGLVGHDAGLPVDVAVGDIEDFLDTAAGHLGAAAYALGLAQQAAAHLTGVEPETS
jgi:hypothetical protein